jgi:hypothetical protein
VTPVAAVVWKEKGFGFIVCDALATQGFQGDAPQPPWEGFLQSYAVILRTHV